MPQEAFQVALLDAAGVPLLVTTNVVGYGSAKYLAHAYAKLRDQFIRPPHRVTVQPMGCAQPEHSIAYIELHQTIVDKYEK